MVLLAWGGVGFGAEEEFVFLRGLCWFLLDIEGSGIFGEGNEVCYRSSIPIFSYPARLPTNILGSSHYP